jgi:lipid-binding SYLF domain-containing protein
LFAGVSLNGSAIREDEGANQRFYHKPLRNRDIVMGPAASVGSSGHPLPEVAPWQQVLARFAK